MISIKIRKKMKISYIFTLSFIVIICLVSHTNGLKCYSCSTEAGDPNCSEDGFNQNLAYVECPPGSDVCVRAIQMSTSNPNNNVGTVVFRSCGTSVKAEKPEITNLGYVPLYNDCIIHKIGKDSIFAGSTFQICSCSKDLGNSKGEIKCK